MRVLVLAVDTSSAVVTAAVAEVSGDETSLVAERSADAPNRHGELLAPLLAELLVDAGVTSAQLGALCAGLGPGPFTGLRVGVVTAASMADALGLPAYGACSLDAIALAHSDGAPTVVCTDARRRQVYWAAYDADGRRAGELDLAPAGDVAVAIERDVHVVGAGALLYREAFDGFTVHEEPAHPRALDLVRLVAGRVGGPPDVLEPLYLRRPDAVPPGAPKAVTPA